MGDKISIKDIFKEDFENIWNNPNYENIEIRKFGYAQQDRQEKNSLLFIGINPSNPKETKESFFYNHEDGIHKYFKKFEEISENTGLPWSHIDLLFVRQTQQHVVKDLLYSKDKNIENFFNDQLELSKRILEKIKPSIIVVNNSLARDLLWNWLKYEFDEDLGTDIVNNTDSALHKTPIFFTSMLTGQRALDKGSYRRLIWHINYVKNKIDTNK